MIYHCIVDFGQILWLAGVNEEEESVFEPDEVLVDVKKLLFQNDRHVILSP